MSSWRDEYLGALRERDKKEKANEALYNAYTKLADHTTSLSIPTEPPSQTPPTATARKASAHSVRPQSPADTERLRLDLAEAQRSKGELQSRLQMVTAELEKLRTQAKSDGRRIGELVQERGTLMAKLRDRDEELRGKTKLLEDVHDETVSLTLQLNMAEEQADKLKGENEDLVTRWMARMGKEADAMNNASKYS